MDYKGQEVKEVQTECREEWKGERDRERERERERESRIAFSTVIFHMTVEQMASFPALCFVTTQLTPSRKWFAGSNNVISSRYFLNDVAPVFTGAHNLFRNFAAFLIFGQYLCLQSHSCL